MKQEHFLILIVGLLIITYVLDAVVNPLPLVLVTPYHYFTPEIMFTYPFTTTSIVLKAVVVFISPLLVFSFLEFKKITKGIIFLVLSGLIQLYSLQSVLTNSKIIPLEWALSLTLAGMILVLFAVIYIVTGLLQKFHKNIIEDPYSPEAQSENE